MQPVAATEPALPLAPPVSETPATRLEQSKAFWRRNPGYQPLLAIEDGVRGLLSMFGAGRKINELTAPTDHGYGQLMIDQMMWQIRSRRQPDNEWWMRMNARLVGDGLTAEAYLRAGRADELTSPQHRAWLVYLRLSDRLRELAESKPGVLQALEGILVLRAAVRKAYWVAHDESIQAGRRESVTYLKKLARDFPAEAEFSSSWARTIKLFRYLNPIATGRIAMSVQRWILPNHQPIESGPLTAVQQAFVAIAQLADPTWERDVAGR